ncbi:PREDICTED: cysteine-rich DPF motif domain-containing protein 1 [Propithecus coquereli]|uniref:cysteine-rich DPF motif domain-containing protein 1 n=1 Tax=Propithecus coquereli TaxID=379532 RepID=UPI00063F3676|nr:PREDICTED: cysteine-rich DPF motif domain-containing protein 1 [Propithecus coquereli]
MVSEAEHRPLGVFECELCALTAPYSYVGQKPPNTQSVVPIPAQALDASEKLHRVPRVPASFLSPFFQECSLFYSKRFCLPCVQKNISAFPQEIRQDLEKRKAPSKRPSSQPSSQT